MKPKWPSFVHLARYLLSLVEPSQLPEHMFGLVHVSIFDRTTSVANMLLATLAAATADLKVRISELERLREQVRKAQLSE